MATTLVFVSDPDKAWELHQAGLLYAMCNQQTVPNKTIDAWSIKGLKGQCQHLPTYFGYYVED